MATSTWSSPSSIFKQESFFEEEDERKNDTPRAGMTRSRREQLEQWREQKRQRLADTPHPVKLERDQMSTSENPVTSFAARFERQSLSSIGSDENTVPPHVKAPRMSLTSPVKAKKTVPLEFGSIAKTPFTTANAIEQKRYGLYVRPTTGHHNVETMPPPNNIRSQKSENVKREVEQNKLFGKHEAQAKAQESPKAESLGELLASEQEDAIPKDSIEKLEVKSMSVLAQEDSVDSPCDTQIISSSKELCSEIQKRDAEDEEKMVDLRDEYDIHLLLLANDTLVQHLAESEARRVRECNRLRQERDDLRMELRMQESRFKIHAQRLEDTMQQGIIASLDRIQELTKELEEAHNTIAKLQKKVKQ